jgi:alcohol dehydrogenase
MSMYATDGTLRIGVSHARAVMPEMLEFIATNDFAAESVTTTLADWDDAPSAFAEQSTKVVIQRDRMLAS